MQPNPMYKERVKKRVLNFPQPELVTEVEDKSIVSHVDASVNALREPSRHPILEHVRYYLTGAFRR